MEQFIKDDNLNYNNKMWNIIDGKDSVPKISKKKQKIFSNSNTSSDLVQGNDSKNPDSNYKELSALLNNHNRKQDNVNNVKLSNTLRKSTNNNKFAENNFKDNQIKKSNTLRRSKNMNNGKKSNALNALQLYNSENNNVGPVANTPMNNGKKSNALDALQLYNSENNNVGPVANTPMNNVKNLNEINVKPNLRNKYEGNSNYTFNSNNENTINKVMNGNEYITGNKNPRKIEKKLFTNSESNNTFWENLLNKSKKKVENNGKNNGKNNGNKNYPGLKEHKALNSKKKPNKNNRENNKKTKQYGSPGKGKLEWYNGEVNNNPLKIPSKKKTKKRKNTINEKGIFNANKVKIISPKKKNTQEMKNEGYIPPAKFKTLNSGKKEIMKNWPKLNEPDGEFYTKIDDYMLGKTGMINYKLEPIDASSGHTCNKSGGIRDLYKYQKIVAEYLAPGHPYRGLLLYHGLGSGKTATAIGLINEYLINDPTRTIIAITPPALKQNIVKEMEGLFTNLFGKGKSESQLKRYINKHIRVISYIEIANRLKGITKDDVIKKDSEKTPALDNTLVIIDEAHNVVDLTSEYKKQFAIIRQAISRARNIKLLLMTATPIKNKPYEIGMLINLLKSPDGYKLPDTEKEFNEEFIDINEAGIKVIKNKDKLIRAFKGLISYYGGSEFDITKFAIKEQLPIVEAEMSDYQYEQWRKARKGEIKKEEKNKNKEDFEYIASRKVSDYPTGACYAKNINSTVKDLDKYSMKLKMLEENLSNKKYNGKHFVYSYWKANGVNAIVTALKNKGWKEYTVSFLGKNKDISKLKDNPKAFVTLIGDLSQNNKRLIINSFNHESNYNASKIPILIADRQYKEGISLMDTNYVHVFEPSMSISDFNQIVARAVRTCSHVRLSYPDKWFVQIFTYFSKKSIRIDDTTDLTTDYIVGNIAQSKEYIKNQFLTIMKEVAIDCVTNKERNEKELQCYRPKSRKILDNKKPDLDKNFMKMHSARVNKKCTGLPKRECEEDLWCYYKNKTCNKKTNNNLLCEEFNESALDCERRDDCEYKNSQCKSKFTGHYNEYLDGIEFDINKLEPEEENRFYRLKDDTDIELRKKIDKLLNNIDKSQTEEDLILIINELKIIAKNYPLRHNYFDIDEIMDELKIAKPKLWSYRVKELYQEFIELLINIKNNPNSYTGSSQGEFFYSLKLKNPLNIKKLIENKNEYLDYTIKITPGNIAYYVSSTQEDRRINLKELNNGLNELVFKIHSGGAECIVNIQIINYEITSVFVKFTRDTNKEKGKYKINELEKLWHL